MEVTRYLATRMAITLQQELEFLKQIGESKTDVWWVIDVSDQAIGATGIHGINWLDSNVTDTGPWGYGASRRSAKESGATAGWEKYYARTGRKPRPDTRLRPFARVMLC